MTPYQQKFVNHILAIYQLDRDYAFWSANDLAQIDPFQLQHLPKLVKSELTKRQLSSVSPMPMKPD